MSSAGVSHGTVYTWTLKHDADLWMLGVTFYGQTYKKCKRRIEEIFLYWADMMSNPPDRQELFYAIFQRLIPILIDEYNGIGAWLIPCPENVQSTAVWWMVDIMA